MKKDKLISLLQSIPGNPDVLLWEGLVCDWMDISSTIVPMELGKLSREFFLFAAQKEDTIESQKRNAEAMFRKQEWRALDDYELEDKQNLWFGKHRKTVYLLQGKRRNKTHSDRLGNSKY